MKIALFGYSGSGKTTLATALTGKTVESFDPARPATSVARVSDQRLEKLAADVRSVRVTFPEVTIYDYRGVPPTAGFSEPVFLSLLEADAILLVGAGYAPDSTPADDLASLCLEMAFRDSQRFSEILKKRQMEVHTGRRKANPTEEKILERAVAWLAEGRFLQELDVSPSEQVFLSSLRAVTSRRVISICNGQKRVTGTLTADAATLSIPENRLLFWRQLLKALDQIIFYTIGVKEARGWFLPAGGTALDAASRIHTEIGQRFIRAEVISYSDFESLGSLTACRQKGLMRLEGKEYVVNDGDIINIRCSR